MTSNKIITDNTIIKKWFNWWMWPRDDSKIYKMENVIYTKKFSDTMGEIYLKENEWKKEE